MKQIYILTILILVALTGFSQEPRKAIGIRGGISSGFEYRVFSGELSSYKVLFSTRQEGLQLTGLKEFHQPDAFDFCPDLSFIYGFGAHVGFESWHVTRYYNDLNTTISSREHRSGPIAGLDGLVAAEYTIPAIPLVVGLEAKPYFNLMGKNFFQLQPFDIALTLKYTF
jgi:hypothetical protein